MAVDLFLNIFVYFRLKSKREKKTRVNFEAAEMESNNE